MQTNPTNIAKQLRASKHQRVICTDTTKLARTDYCPNGRIRRGQIYHVTEISISREFGVGLRILGKPVILESGEAWWKAERFRVIA